MSFGSRLRNRREAMGLKQSELGKMLGVTGSAIGNYENGVSSPKADVLYKVFDVLQCDANYLFQDEMTDAAGLVYSESEHRLLDAFDRINDTGRQKIIDYAEDLLATRKYLK